VKSSVASSSARRSPTSFEARANAACSRAAVRCDSHARCTLEAILPPLPPPVPEVDMGGGTDVAEAEAEAVATGAVAGAETVVAGRTGAVASAGAYDEANENLVFAATAAVADVEPWPPLRDDDDDDDETDSGAFVAFVETTTMPLRGSIRRSRASTAAARARSYRFCRGFGVQMDGCMEGPDHERVGQTKSSAGSISTPSYVTENNIATCHRAVI
jgi:hypothetical protein